MGTVSALGSVWLYDRKAELYCAVTVTQGLWRTLKGNMFQLLYIKALCTRFWVQHFNETQLRHFPLGLFFFEENHFKMLQIYVFIAVLFTSQTAGRPAVHNPRNDKSGKYLFAKQIQFFKIHLDLLLDFTAILSWSDLSQQRVVQVALFARISIRTRWYQFSLLMFLRSQNRLMEMKILFQLS